MVDTPDSPIADDDALPAHYSDLQALRAEAFRMLADAVVNRRTPFHTFALGTLGPDGGPRVRTVVLRGFDPVARTVRLHTDRRSAKFDEIQQSRRASAMFYDPPAKVQVRLEGVGSVHVADPVAADAWAATRDFSRECYRGPVGSGAESTDPVSGIETTVGDGSDAFSAILLHFTSLDWMYLHARGHRRARFSWSDDGAETGTWLVP